MPNVMLVEDSRVQARQIQFLLQEAGFDVVICGDGRQALAAIAQSAPDIVLTDLQMPEMNGLQLVEAIRSGFPQLPVILMTAHGSEEIAVEALQRGAASYVPKRRLDTDLVSTLTDVLKVAKAGRSEHRLFESLSALQFLFEIGNDPTLIPSLISHVQQQLKVMKLGDEADVIRIGVALHEGLLNAIHHGNLELDSSLRAQSATAYQDLGAQRSTQLPFRDRRVFVTAHVSRSEARFVIRDEGPGFNPAQLPDPTAADGLERVSGRGLLLIRTFMDEIRHNDSGNELTMIKRRAR